MGLAARSTLCGTQVGECRQSPRCGSSCFGLAPPVYRGTWPDGSARVDALPLQPWSGVDDEGLLGTAEIVLDQDRDIGGEGREAEILGAGHADGAQLAGQGDAALVDRELRGHARADAGTGDAATRRRCSWAAPSGLNTPSRLMVRTGERPRRQLGKQDQLALGFGGNTRLAVGAPVFFRCFFGVGSATARTGGSLGKA